MIGTPLSGFKRILYAGVSMPYGVSLTGKGPMKSVAALFSKFTAFCLVVLAATTVAPQAAETNLIAANAVWRYYNLQTPPPTNWNARNFDDSGWASGPAQL